MSRRESALSVGSGRGAVVGVDSGDVSSFDVFGSASGASVDGVVDGLARLGESSVSPSVLVASDVVCNGESVADPDRESVENPEAASSDDPDGELAEESVEVLDEVSDGESDGSARASPCPESTAAPIPKMIASPAIRPMPHTRLRDEDCFAR